jgi:hypothetical protein
MKIIDIQPKDIYVNIELSLSEIDNISLALSKSVCSSTEEKAIANLVDFSKMLNDVLEDIKK